MLAILAPLFALLLVSRRPATLLHASFWAEDGWIWYPDAYARGLRCLAAPITGYLQTLSRLVALASLAFPLAWAPTLFAVAALAVELAAALFLLSPRLDAAWPSLGGRLAFALLYLALPNSFEVFGNLTNAQWHLALLAFLVVVSQPPATKAGIAVDLAILLLSGLSGPLTLFLVPVALHEAWRRRAHEGLVTWWRLAVLVAAAAVQLPFELPSIHRRAPVLGANVDLFARIASQQVVLGAVTGRHAMAAWRGLALWQDGVLPAAILALALLLVGLALWRGPVLFRQFAFFAFAAFAATLRAPVSGGTTPAWPTLTQPDLGDRYYVLPMLAWLAALLVLARRPDRPLRAARLARGVPTLLLCLCVIAIPGDWRLGGNFHGTVSARFARAARAFATAPSGTVAYFPIDPPWVQPMRLVRR